MRFGFWSSRSDFKLAREIRIAAGTVGGSGDYLDKARKNLRKIIIGKPPRNEADYRKRVLGFRNNLVSALKAFKENFRNIEEIKYNADILLNERIKQLNELEHELRQLTSQGKLSKEAFQDFEKHIHEIRKRASSFIKDDKERDRRLNWRI